MSQQQDRCGPALAQAKEVGTLYCCTRLQQSSNGEKQQHCPALARAALQSSCLRLTSFIMTNKD